MLLEWLAQSNAPLVVWLAIGIVPPIVLMLAEGTGRLVEAHDQAEQAAPPVPASAGPVVDGSALAPRGPVLMTTRVPGGPLGLRRDRTHGHDVATRRD